jgi:hypothetical protein
LFEIVEHGCHVAAMLVMYHGVQAWSRRLAKRRGIEFTLFDAVGPNGLTNAVSYGETGVV